MAFVIIATGASSRSPLRTLPMPSLLGALAAAALAMLASGGAIGYWFGAPAVAMNTTGAPRWVGVATGTETTAGTAGGAGTAGTAETAVLGAAPERAPAAATPFTLEQLAAISARLFRLESEAAHLGRRIGILRKEAPSGSATGNVVAPVVEPAGASGGPLLASAGAAAAATSSGAATATAAPHELSAAGLLDAQLTGIEQLIDRVAAATARDAAERMRIPTRLPIPGAELTSSFGNRIDPLVHSHAFHAGLDFAARTGTPIVAAAGGSVAFAGFRSDFGRVVEIDHGNGLTTRYAHASELLVRARQIVAPGEIIARVGSSGRSTGPHLHFEVVRAGSAVDPKRYLAGL